MSGILTAERLRELLAYDPETGVFSWRVNRPRAAQGAPAGTADGRGYIRIGVDGGIYRAHRLAWLYMTGQWPEEEVDHKDGDKANNRWANLRDVPRAANQQNLRRPHKRGTSGALGVSAHKATGKWRARLWKDGKCKSLGLYDTQEAAHAAYVEAKRTEHQGCTL
jgi:hypothetical protein